MSLVSIIKQIQAAANTGVDVAHLEQELQQILSTGKNVAADISGDIKQVEALVAEAKAHTLTAGAILEEVKTAANKLQSDVAEIVALLPVLKDLAAQAPKLAELLKPAEAAK